MSDQRRVSFNAEELREKLEAVFDSAATETILEALGIGKPPKDLLVTVRIPGEYRDEIQGADVYTIADYIFDSIQGSWIESIKEDNK